MPPERVVDVLALVGDAVDNVPGVPGIGDKGARDLVREFGSLEACARERGQGEARRLPRGARRSTARTRCSRKRLVTLRTDVPITLDLEALRCQRARPRRGPRALHRAGVRGPGQGVRAGARRPAPRLRGRRRSSQAVARRGREARAGRPHGSVAARHLRRADAGAHRWASRWPGRPGQAVVRAARPHAARGARAAGRAAASWSALRPAARGPAVRKLSARAQARPHAARPRGHRLRGPAPSTRSWPRTC